MLKYLAPAIASAMLAVSFVAVQAMPVQKGIGAGTEVTRVDLLCGHGRHFELGRCVLNHDEFREPPREEPPREEHHRRCPRGYHLGENGDRCWPNHDNHGDQDNQDQ
jgi:hypothetical protein